MLVWGWLTVFGTAAELEPTQPQGYRPTTLAVTEARIVTEPGVVLERGTVLLRDGRIVAVGPEVVVPPDAVVLKLPGFTVVPGFIDAGSSRLIPENVTLPQVARRPVDASKEAIAGLQPDDHAAMTPQFETHLVVSTSEADLAKYRRGGFCVVHVVPKGRIASGQSCLVSLTGAPPREAVIRANAMSSFRIWERSADHYPSTMMGVFAHLRQKFLDAERAALQTKLAADQPTIDPAPLDPVWTALATLRATEQPVLWDVARQDDYERALTFSNEWGLSPVLWGLHEPPRDYAPWRDQELTAFVSLDFGEEPAEPKDDSAADDPRGHYPKRLEDARITAERKARWRERVGLAAALHEHQIEFGFSTEGLKSAEEALAAVRRTISAGLPAELALGALTLLPANLLGIDADHGKLAPGYWGNLTILTGPLEHADSKVRGTIVRGRLFDEHPTIKPVAPPTQNTSPGVTIEGTWDVTFETGEPPFQATWELQPAGQGFGGRFLSPQGDGVITRGVVKEQSLELDVSIGAGAGAVSLKFTGEVREGRITGRVKSPFAAATSFTAKRRATVTPPANPVELGGVEGDDAISALTATQSGQPAESKSGRPLEFPADRRSRPLVTGGNVLIRGGTILTGTGETLPDHSLLIRGGLIAAIGPQIEPDPGMTVIDATGRFVMPGIIDTHSHIMISNGLGGVNEATHSIVCEVRVRDVVNTADPQEYRALAGGVTTLRLLHGSANVIGGQDAVVQLKHGATIAEHLYPRAHSGVKFALGENVKFRRGRFPNTRLGVEATLQRAFIEGLEYRREWREHQRREKARGPNDPPLLAPRRDLRLEALAEIVSQEKFIHSHCYRSDEILMLLRVAESHGLRVWSLQHVLEGYKVAPEIVKHGASCSTFADWWAYKIEAFDATPHNAALLHAAGANVVIKSDNDELMRHMNQEAAKTVRYGSLPPRDALSLITRNAARELGIDDRLGTLEVGKQGDVAIFNAHPLNTFARCELTLIAGEPYFVRERQPTAMSVQGLESSRQPRAIPLPAPEERLPEIAWPAITQGTFALTNAELHPVDGPMIPRGTLLSIGGRIQALGTDVVIPEGCPTIDLRGLQVYPGLIDAGTTIGLVEIGKVVETHDYAEVGQFQPDLRAGVGINPDSELIPVARAGGITTALIRPTGGVISGQASVMQTAGWTAPEMTRVLSAGLQIQWPGVHSQPELWRQLYDWWQAAKRYDAARNTAAAAGGLDRLIDPRYEALRPYVRGEQPIFIEAQSEQHLAEALLFAEREKLRLVLCGASDAWKLTDELVKAKVPVIVGAVMREPLSAFDPFDATYANAGRLHEAGVPFCIRSDNAANSRNAPFEAGMAVAYGLPEEAGLRSVTLSAAEILGIAAETGSLTPGKLTDLVILDGSPLQVTSQVKGVVIAGQPHRPESRQTKFYEKYRQRLTATP